MDECRHGMNPAWCAECRPPTTPPRASGTFVWIKPARYYHLPERSEVLWDPSEAKRPGERVDVTAEDVRSLVRSGSLERGCLKCGARA